MTKQQMHESLLKEEHNEFGADINDPRVKELVALRVEDLNRKGCAYETYPGPECHSCGSCVNGHCPLEDWETRHPEFKNDGVEQKIKALETELYGWHKPPTNRAEHFDAMATVEELKARIDEEWQKIGMKLIDASYRDEHINLSDIRDNVDAIARLSVELDRKSRRS